MKVRSLLIRIHITCVILTSLNWAAATILNFSLAESVALGVKLAVAGSGFALFFFYVKPWQRIAWYFGIYAMTAVLLISALIFRSQVGLIAFVLLAYFVYPDEKQYEEDGLIIATEYEGIMANCCVYLVKEQKYGLFERERGAFRTDGTIDFSTIQIDRADDELILTYEISSSEIEQTSVKIEQ
ncbi:MAG TPA: hypothetical protein DCE41_19295 [Cytophagales bacterium]|nr:hypothetical protein [Cytophagales bacterium]HAA18070.1 hypothetical protein [Cytophagales bacterium]